MSLARTVVEGALAKACRLDVVAFKPGNVSLWSAGHRMQARDFLASARVAVPALCVPQARVGVRIESAMRATLATVGCNTNLGIVLLLAPLACAAGRDHRPLRDGLSRVLSGLSIADARAAYAAIRLADPGGLGRADAQDVRGDPTLTLREAMALAAKRDSIAREYVTDYDVTFRLAVPAIREARAGGLSRAGAAAEAYLRVLSEVPDTLIARKEGAARALAVSERAREVLGAGALGSGERSRAEEAFDRELRERGNRLNPGTSADLVAAAMFVSLVEER